MNVRLPRFRLEHQSDSIARALRSMGIKDVFDDKMADLSGMSMEKLHVNDFFHKYDVPWFWFQTLKKFLIGVIVF